ncbi:hypothetical protein BJX63DRAFT_214821 [Aspergillus granulosus]|uniref:Uncharacterized protein n=1 Tax=Aspergillus granulosus TaxID=176169 RepID=A0ABR4HEC8_9EURO
MKAMAISRKLGGMPLAIQQAGSFLSYGMISLSDYNQKFHMRYLDKTLKAPLRKYVGSYEKGRTVWTTFDILYSALVQRSLDAIQLLTLTSFLGRGRIPISTISGKGIHNKNPWDPLYPVPTPSGKKGHVPELLQWLSEVRSDIDRVALAVSELERSGFALLHRGADGIAIESIFIHDLARSFIRSKVPQQSLSDVLVASFLISGLQLYDGCSIPSETLLRKHMGRLVEVLDLFLTGIPDHMLAPDGQYFRLCAVVAPVYARICRFQGRLDTAANLWTIALQDKFVPDMNGAERDMTREHYMEAAKIDIRLGNYKDAIDKYSMVVTSSETGHQQDDELAIQAASYLRQARERYEQHKQDLERAVTAFSTPKAVRHNISHAVTHGTIHDLGNLCSDQGKLEEAEEMYQRALAGRENIYTLDTVYNLGCIYSDQGKLEKAEDMYQRALLGYKEALGPDHTSTLDTVYNLGCLYSDQGKLEDAEEMYQRALAGREKVLGPDHTSTLDTVYNLGNFYSQQGKLDEAEEMYQRALAGYKKALGPDHTSTLDTANNLAYLYFDQGKLEEAEKMYQ